MQIKKPLLNFLLKRLPEVPYVPIPDYPKEQTVFDVYIPNCHSSMNLCILMNKYALTAEDIAIILAIGFDVKAAREGDV